MTKIETETKTEIGSDTVTDRDMLTHARPTDYALMHDARTHDVHTNPMFYFRSKSHFLFGFFIYHVETLN